MSQDKIRKVEGKLGKLSVKVPNKKTYNFNIYNSMYLEMSSEVKSSQVTFAAEEASLSSYGVNSSEGDVITDEM